MLDSIAVVEPLLLHRQREVPQGDCVHQVDTVHKVQKFLNPVLWENTVAPKETRNLMTVSHVTLGFTVQVILIQNPLVHVHLDTSAQVEHPLQSSLSPVKVISRLQPLLPKSSVLLELIRRLIVLSGALTVQKRTFVMKWAWYFQNLVSVAITVHQTASSQKLAHLVPLIQMKEKPQ